MRREALEVTASGACTPTVECARVSSETLARLAAAFRSASTVRHRRDQASPHYGARELSARWTGGRCVVADSADAVVVEEDRSRFYAAFDALVGAAFAVRPDAGLGP